MGLTQRRREHRELQFSASSASLREAYPAPPCAAHLPQETLSALPSPPTQSLTMPKTAAPELPILLFETEAAWEAWLAENHATSPGVWMRIAKKNAAISSVTYAQALDVALCWGWIDSQKKSFDEDTFLQKFGPRGPKSIWSKINREKIEALTAAGRMRPAGHRCVDAARADGRWDAAYDSARTITVPDDLRAALDANPAAAAFFAKLDGANRYAVLWRVQTARRPETRARKVAELVAMLARGEKIH